MTLKDWRDREQQMEAMEKRPPLRAQTWADIYR